MKLQAGAGRPRPWGQAPRGPFPVRPGLEPGSPLRVAGGAMRTPRPRLTGVSGTQLTAQGTVGGRQPLAHRPGHALCCGAELSGCGRMAAWPQGLGRLLPGPLRGGGRLQGAALGPSLHQVTDGENASPGLVPTHASRSHPRWQWHPAPWRCSRAHHPCPPSQKPRVFGQVWSSHPSHCLLPPSDWQQARCQAVPRAPAHQDRVRRGDRACPGP